MPRATARNRAATGRHATRYTTPRHAATSPRPPRRYRHRYRHHASHHAPRQPPRKTGPSVAPRPRPGRPIPRQSAPVHHASAITAPLPIRLKRTPCRRPIIARCRVLETVGHAPLEHVSISPPTASWAPCRPLPVLVAHTRKGGRFFRGGRGLGVTRDPGPSLVIEKC